VKEKIKTYFDQYYPFEELLEEEEKQSRKLTFNEFKGSRLLPYFIMFLQALPWVCMLGFVVSFFPAFQLNYSFTIPLMDKQVSLTGIIKIISISGLIGFGTNRLAIRMLFRPLKKRPIWGQGLIPAQKDRIIYTLANGMYEHILNQKLIRKRLDESGLVKKINNILIDGTTGIMRDQALRDELKIMIYESLDDYLKQKEVRKEILGIIDQRVEANFEGVQKLIFQTYKRLNPADYESIIFKVVDNVPHVSLDIIHRIEEEIDRSVAYIRMQRGVTYEFIMRTLTDAMDNIDIPSLLRGQMKHFDEARLEKMVREATNEQLLYIQYLGALLGMLGGLLIWQPELMTLVYLMLFGILYLIDLLLYRLKFRKLEKQ